LVERVGENLLQRPAQPTVATPDAYPAVAAAITRLIAESATALANLKARRLI
jgi:hypothetical protein